MKNIVKTTFALAATALLAACHTTPQQAQQGLSDDECKASTFQHLVGTQASALDQSALPERTRILYPKTVATMDHRLDRLNIQVDEQGTIRAVVCG